MSQQTEDCHRQVEDVQQPCTMTDASPSPTPTAATNAPTTSDVSNPHHPKQSKPKKSAFSRWFKAVKQYASPKTLRVDRPARDAAITVRSSVEVSNPTSTPPSSLTPITTTSPSPCTCKYGLVRADVPASQTHASNFVQHLSPNDEPYSSPATQTLPTILVTSVTPTSDAPDSPTIPSSHDTLSSTPAPASVTKQPRRHRHRHRQPTMLTPELMRDIEKANKKRHDIVMRGEEKRMLRALRCKPVVSPRPNMVRANPLRWSQD